MNGYAADLDGTGSEAALPVRVFAYIAGAIAGALGAGAALVLAAHTALGAVGLRYAPIAMLIGALLAFRPFGARILEPGAMRPLIAFQVFAATAALALPFGFDKPSEWGLDFGHFLAIAALYAAAVVAGVAAAAAQQKWIAFAFQIASAVVVAALASTDALSR